MNTTYPSVEQALAMVELTLTLNWSQPRRVFRLSDRSDRARVYELVLREGSEADLLRYVDGALLVDLWDELVLPRPSATVAPNVANVSKAPNQRDERPTNLANAWWKTLTR